MLKGNIIIFSLVEYLWLPFAWGDCDATCGNAMRTRTVWCVRNNELNYVIAEDFLCNGLPRPADSERCEVPGCVGDVTLKPPSNDPDQGMFELS